MVFVDTSVFIDFFNQSDTQGAKSLYDLLIERDEVGVNGLVCQEVLQGIKSDKAFNDIRSILDNFVYIPTPESIYTESANLYRSLRNKGLTIRKSIDVLIAQCCINNNLTLLHADRDFVHIAQHTRLRLYKTFD